MNILDGMNTPTTPTAQQLLLAIVDGLRLDVKTDTSGSTRKTIAAGERVKPVTREALVFEVARALNDVHLLKPAAPAAQANVRDAELDDHVARGLGEFLAGWDAALSDMRTYNPTATGSYLAVLPFVRLGLEDLALRWAARSLGRASYFLDEDVNAVVDALVDGSAFIECLRHALRAAETKRARLVEALPSDTVRGWEEEHVLPNKNSLAALSSFFSATGKTDAGLNLELRFAIALTELWTWLREVDVPERARRQMAQGFIEWTKVAVTLMGGAKIEADERAWTMIRGARYPITQERLDAFAEDSVTHGFARDLRALGRDWSKVVRANSGALADRTLAAEDERAARGENDPDVRLGDDELLAVTRCVPYRPWAKSKDESGGAPVVTAAMLEAAGTAALHAGDYGRAIPLLAGSAELAPLDAWPRIHLARALHLVGNLREAEVVARAATALGDVPDGHLVLGSILIEMGRPREALEPLERAGTNTPQPAVVCAYRAMAFAALGEWTRAVEHACRGTEIDKNNAACWEALIVAQRALGNDVEAKRAAKELSHLGGRRSNPAT